jgi:hypothetical protein
MLPAGSTILKDDESKEVDRKKKPHKEKHRKEKKKARELPKV